MCFILKFKQKKNCKKKNYPYIIIAISWIIFGRNNLKKLFKFVRERYLVDSSRSFRDEFIDFTTIFRVIKV